MNTGFRHDTNSSFKSERYTPNSEELTRSNSLKLESGPHRIAINEKSNFIYVLNMGSNSILSIDGHTNTISDRLAVDGVYDISIDPESNRLCMLRNQIISIVDIGTDNSLHYENGFSIELDSYHNTAFAYCRNLIYIANKDDKSVDVIDSETCNMVTSIPLEKDPLDIKIDHNTKMIYVGIGPRVNLIVIDGNVNEVIKEVDLNAHESVWHISKQHSLRQIYLNLNIGKLYLLYKQPFFIEFPVSGGTEYQDGIIVFDLSNWKILEDQKLRRGLNQICVSHKTNNIYCANSRYKEVEVLNEDGYSDFRNFSLHPGKYEIAMNSTTNKLYVASNRIFRNSLLDVYDLDDLVSF